MELPEAVVAQAEAAASTNQPKASGHHSERGSEASGEAARSEGSHASSSKNDHAQPKASKPSAAKETPIEQIPQLAYGPQLGQVDFSQDGFDTKAKVAGKTELHTILFLPP